MSTRELKVLVRKEQFLMEFKTNISKKLKMFGMIEKFKDF
jgi:hypothetical protein